MSKEINPPLKVGDRIVLISIEDPISPITIGTKGTVIGVGSDPWSVEPIYKVDWDNGRFLNLIGDTDVWYKEDEKENLTESVSGSKKPCETLSQGKEFCKKLQNILSSGTGGKGARTLKNDNFNFWRDYISGEYVTIQKKIVLSPGTEEFKKRYKDLLKFKQVLNKFSNCSKMKDAISKDLIVIKTKGITMLVNDDDEYSLFNRLDSHYSNQAYILTKVVLEIYDENIDEYDNQEIISTINEMSNDYDPSFYGFIDTVIQSILDDENDRETLMGYFQYTRDKGYDVESKAAEVLRKNGYEVHEFGGDYSFVDYFGVDMLATKDGVLRPIQVSSGRKSEPKFYEFQDNDCECWLLYPASKGRFKRETILSESDKNRKTFIDEILPVMTILKADKDQSIFKFLVALRDSGITNMMSLSNFTWGGEDYLRRYLQIQELQGSYPVIEDKDQEEELIDLARDSQRNMIQAAFNYLSDEGEEASIENINRVLRRLGSIAFKYYTLKL